jgi:hypothetical protein
MFAANNCKLLEKEKITVKIKSNVKAGGINMQHNQTAARGLKVKTGIRGGETKQNIDPAFIRR